MRRHVEKHFTSSQLVRDTIIGMSDGLTVPFALAAGLSSASASTAIIVTAGLAEIVAGSISMGLGGYLAGKSDVQHYQAEEEREQRETVERPQAEKDEVTEVLAGYGLTPEESRPIVEALSKRPGAWVQFMMRFELGLENPDPRQALKSALTIAGSYIVGGLVPLSPYFITHNVRPALITSAIVTLLALAVFGFLRGKVTSGRPFQEAGRTVLIGGLASTAAYLLARLV